MVNRRFGWHSGTVDCWDVNVANDLTILGDIVFGDVSVDTFTCNAAATFNGGVTLSGGGMDFESLTYRAIRIGTKASAATSLPITATSFEAEPGNNYLFGLFTAVATTAADLKDELRSSWMRTRVNDGCHIGNTSGPYGFGVCGVELQLKFYADSAATNTYGWQNSGVWAQLETQGAAGVNFKSGSHAQAVLANVGLTATTTIDSGANVAGVTVNTNTATASVTATGGFYGIFITDIGPAAHLDFQSGIFIDDGVATTGMSIGNCTTGISLDGDMTDGIKIAASNTIVDGIEIANTCTYGLNISGLCTTAGILLGSTNKLSFYDSGIYINSSADTKLDLVADGGIFLTVPGSGYYGLVFGGETDWGTGLTGPDLDGTGYDWVSQTVGRVTTANITASAYAAAYHAFTVGASQNLTSSFFGTWTELYVKNSVVLTGASNLAAVWGQIECGNTVTLSDSDDFTAAVYANVIAAHTLTTASGHAVNGVRAQNEISSTTISHSGRLAAFECLIKSGGGIQNWDYGLYVAGADVGIDITTSTTGIDIGDCTTGINISGTTTYAIRVIDDAKIAWGTAADIPVSWTGQELLFEDTRTIDVSDGYNRTIHVGSTITMTESRYAAVSCYATLAAGSAGKSAFGGSFSLEQGTTKTVDGHFSGVMAEVKNRADGCSTAEALFCRWANYSTSGFGGNAHSFIRFEDLSSSKGGTPVQSLFNLYGMDATTSASATEIVCQKGSSGTCSHVIKITVGGVPYWLMMDDTAPA